MNQMLDTSAVGSADTLLAEIRAEEDEEDGILDASKIQTKVVDWLWYPYLPKNMLVMGEGESELGKTAVELDLIAYMTTGRALPDGSVIEPIGVVYVTFEDLPEYTIKPRLEAARADLTRVRIIANVTDRETGSKRPLDIQEPSDLNLLRKAVGRVQAGYVVIDPITSAFGGKSDIYRTTAYTLNPSPLTQTSDYLI